MSYRTTFDVTYTTSQGAEVTEKMTVELPGDNLFDARAEMVYRLSRNPAVRAPFSLTFVKLEHFHDGKWRKIL